MDINWTNGSPHGPEVFTLGIGGDDIRAALTAPHERSDYWQFYAGLSGEWDNLIAFEEIEDATGPDDAKRKMLSRISEELGKLKAMVDEALRREME